MKVLVTGSSGLIGSEAVVFFAERGHRLFGIDNNMRADFFGEGGDTSWNLRWLQERFPDFRHQPHDVRDREQMDSDVREIRPDLVIHCAAQPSHDLAAARPFDDYDVNASGTVNLLEAVRRHAPEAVFLHMSTNKVYGDVPNELPMTEHATRWDYAREEDYHGIDEACRIDRCLHSLFGASKVAADVMAQEYGRYFGMNTGIFRGGCLTGSKHSGVELHGFLNFFLKVAKDGGKYTIFGYKGKQVRDQIHSFDVCRAIEEFAKNPRPGEVYNLGGGRANSISILECIDRVEQAFGRKFDREYSEQARKGDHICYISDLRKLRAHYPDWDITMDLNAIFDEMLGD